MRRSLLFIVLLVTFLLSGAPMAAAQFSGAGVEKLRVFVDASVEDAYGVSTYPQTFFINREGKILGKVLEDVDWTSGNMKHLIRYLLDENQ